MANKPKDNEIADNKPVIDNKKNVGVEDATTTPTSPSHPLDEREENSNNSVDIEALKASIKADMEADRAKEIDAMKAELKAEFKKEEVKQTINVNTRKSIFKDSGKEINILQEEALGYANQIVKGERKPFVCRKDLIGLFPDGLMTSVQGISLNIIFDGRTINLPAQLIKFIEKKIYQKAETEANKRNHDLQAAQKNNIGNY
jgi:hypothetical protein